MNIYSPECPAKLPSDILERVRKMRTEMTDAEALLWQLLRNRRLASAKFRRQHPIGRYILDFYCDEKKLAIELDGSQHQDCTDYDERRDTWLKSQGIRVLRFWNNQMLNQTEDALEEIYRMLTMDALADSLTPGPSPARGRGEGMMP